MKPGRNDPCPCGSGRKYKKGCEARDAMAGPALDAFGHSTIEDMLGVSEGHADAPWEAELVSFQGGIEDDPSARLAAVLIAGGGFALHCDVLAHPPAEPDDIAALLATAIGTTVEQLGQAPPVVRVRHEPVAAALRARLTALPTIVECARDLAGLEDLSASLRQHMTGLAGMLPAISMPHTWAAWGLPGDAVAEVFDAAATFYTAQPWTMLDDEDLLAIDFPDGTRWFASILGGGGQEFGIALYEDEADFQQLFRHSQPDEAFGAMRSAVLSLTFDARADLPKLMRREVTERKWGVAGPQAYPVMWALNTPGGGLTRSQASQLAAAMRAVARYAEFARGALADETASDAVPAEWVDEPSGVRVRYVGLAVPAAPSVWEAPVALTPSLPEGPGANPRDLLDPDGDTATFEERSRAFVDRFSAAQAAAGAPEKRIERDEDSVHTFLDCLLHYHGVGVPALTELELRSFLYGWYPRKVMDSRTTAMTMRGSLRRFFEFLAEHEGIECPWAKPILRDKEAFETRWDECPGGFWWDAGVQEWQSEIFADLDARLLVPPPFLRDDEDSPATLGLEEVRLRDELTREWLAWRDELIRLGLTNPGLLRHRLLSRQDEWERAPHPRLGGRSVREVVARERKARDADTGTPFVVR